MLRAPLLLTISLALLTTSLSAQPAPQASGPNPPPPNGGRGGRGPSAIGTRIADGQAYATLVRLAHQASPADNGRMLLAFEANGFDGIPIWESTDQGASWHFIMNAQDSVDTERPRCNLHWQPHLTEMPRTQNGIAAGTVMLSASTVCQQSPPGRGTANMHLRLYTSSDLGRSWNYLSTFAEGTGDLPVWEPHLLILDDGKLAEFYSDETHKADGYNQMLGHKVSTDGGKTWGQEVYDTAMKGGVERPGMVIIDRLPDRRYIYNFEDVDGPVLNQVHVKFSKDGLNWGNPESRGTPVETEAGQYPANTPNVHWFPIGGPKGIIVVTSRSTAGGANDTAGNTLFWNNNLGVGPWWQAPTPVQKIGNSRAGWTQAMVLQPDNSIFHVTSSGSSNPATANNASANEILFNTAKIDFNRYEAENAKQQGSAVMRDGSMSNGAKSRLAAKDVGKLTFNIYVPKAGAYRLDVNFASIGFGASPRLLVEGKPIAGTSGPAPIDPTKAALRSRDLGTRGTGEHNQLSATAHLRAGMNMIFVAGGEYALDIDYLEVTPS
jgi:hypothetical protein